MATEDLTYFKQLYQKYIDDKLSALEQEELYSFFGEADDADVEEVIDRYLQGTKTLPDLNHLNAVTGGVFLRISEVTNPMLTTQAKPIRRLKKPFISVARAAVAAVAILMLTVGIWLYRQQQSGGIGQEAANINAGTHQATLTLSDGRTIALSDTYTGIIVDENRITYADGTDVGMPAGIDIQELVLETPKGSSYQVTLPDGSQVWLNAESRLRYPSRFDDRQRLVQLDGEAFFDVKSLDLPPGTQSGKKPFKVVTNGQTIEVLGTQFNVNAYINEPAITTSLLEGRVRVFPDAAGEVMELFPGQQSRYLEGRLQVGTADVEALSSWTKDVFIFQNTDLASIMRQLERWYDVRYEGESLPDVRYYGVISRRASLLQVLEVLEATGNVRFQVKERRIMLRK